MCSRTTRTQKDLVPTRTFAAAVKTYEWRRKASSYKTRRERSTFPVEMTVFRTGPVKTIRQRSPSLHVCTGLGGGWCGVSRVRRNSYGFVSVRKHFCRCWSVRCRYTIPERICNTSCRPMMDIATLRVVIACAISRPWAADVVARALADDPTTETRRRHVDQWRRQEFYLLGAHWWHLKIW